MVKKSAGLLIYRRIEGQPEVLLGHPGGPFWQRKDDGAWTIPKGLLEPDEDPLAAARREATEELGMAITGDFRWLGEYKQPGGKHILVWTVEPEARSIPPPLPAMTSRWSGRPVPGACRRFLNLTGRAGLAWHKRAARS